MYTHTHTHTHMHPRTLSSIQLQLCASVLPSSCACVGRSLPLPPPPWLHDLNRNRPSDCHGRVGEVASGLIHSVEPLSSLIYIYTHTFMCVQSLKLFPFSSLVSVLLPFPFTLPIFLPSLSFVVTFSLYRIPVSPPSIPPPSLSLPIHAPSPTFTLSFPFRSTRSELREQWVGRWRWEELRALKLRYDLVHVVKKGKNLFPFSPVTLLSTFNLS